MDDDTALFERIEAGVPFRMPAPMLNLRDPEEPHWTEKFGDLDRYDWFNQQWLEQNIGPLAFFPALLTQGYFGIFSPSAYTLVTRHADGRPKKYYANIQRDERGNVIAAYAVRGGRVGELPSILAHRELLDCLDMSDEVDHGNGWGLDNRSDSDSGVNLSLVGRSENITNATRGRTVNIGLPRGVEYRRKDEQGRPLYGWLRCKRTPGAKVKDKKTGLWKPAPAKTFRSKEVWADRMDAHHAYLQELARIAHGRKKWAHTPAMYDFPQFPPRLRRARRMDIDELIQTILRLNEEAKQLEAVPF